MSTLQKFWNEALAAGIDGKIKLQAAGLQELEDARQKAWINECAAVTDKLACIQEPEQPEEMSVGQDAWQEANSESGEQGTDETCKSQIEYASASTRSSSKVEAEIESRAAQWQDNMVERQKVLDDDRASMVERITAGSKKLKQGFRFETHLKDLMAQSCRAGMARLSDLEVKAEELEAELESQQDMEDKVNKLNTLISDRLQKAAGECDSFRARVEQFESQLKTAM